MRKTAYSGIISFIYRLVHRFLYIGFKFQVTVHQRVNCYTPRERKTENVKKGVDELFFILYNCISYISTLKIDRTHLPGLMRWIRGQDARPANRKTGRLENRRYNRRQTGQFEETEKEC